VPPTGEAQYTSPLGFFSINATGLLQKTHCRRLTAEDSLQKTPCHLLVADSVHVPVCLMQPLDMYRGRLRTMMVTGDHYMTASAVAHGLGIFEKGGKRVVLDMISTKPASEAPTKAPQHVSKAAAAVASRFGGSQHNHEDPSQAALRHSVAQHSRLKEASSPSSRVTFHLNPDEDSGLAAMRASLQESLPVPSASPAAVPSQQAAAVSAAANACQLSARSFSCAPAVYAADAAASPAAVIAASSAFFRSSSLEAASPVASPAAAAAVTSAASPATAKAQSPLLASYLQSRGMAKSAPQAQAGSAQAQPASAQAQPGSAQTQQVSAQTQQVSAQTQQVSAQASPLHAQSRFANRYKSVSLHAPQALRHTLDIAFTLS